MTWDRDKFSGGKSWLKKDQKDLKVEVIKVVHERVWSGRESQVPSGMVQIRVVRWNDGKPLLEKRSFKPGQGDLKWVTGKAQGLSYEDMVMVMESGAIELLRDGESGVATEINSNATEVGTEAENKELPTIGEILSKEDDIPF